MPYIIYPCYIFSISSLQITGKLSHFAIPCGIIQGLNTYITYVYTAYIYYIFHITFIYVIYIYMHIYVHINLILHVFIIKIWLNFNPPLPTNVTYNPGLQALVWNSYFLFFNSFFLVLTKFPFWEEDCALDYNSMKFWDLLNIS